MGVCDGAQGSWAKRTATGLVKGDPVFGNNAYGSAPDAPIRLSQINLPTRSSPHFCGEMPNFNTP